MLMFAWNNFNNRVLLPRCRTPEKDFSHVQKWRSSRARWACSFDEKAIARAYIHEHVNLPRNVQCLMPNGQGPADADLVLNIAPMLADLSEMRFLGKLAGLAGELFKVLSRIRCVGLFSQL
ncbi:unnamed protein product [Haemonchus placei]|uniref:Uncharacterized protein n=1 Tax=Haemonchus placei TaxID=6290 RepID=A0A0N4X1J3_HAEPC|nr:unnamed protein product [Haemonchus placei]